MQNTTYNLLNAANRILKFKYLPELSNPDPCLFGNEQQ